VRRRVARARWLGRSWPFGSGRARTPRWRACSTAAGPAAVKSWAPILQAPTRPASRSGRRSASPSPSTSRATRSRSSAVTVVLLQRADRVLALPHRLDPADRGLRTLGGRVVGDVLHHGGAADERGVLPGPAVLRRVE